MAVLTDSPDLVCQALVDVLTAAKVELGLEDVWYGDQNLIPKTPAVAVEPPTLGRVHAGLPLVTENNFDASIMVYHSRLQDINLTRKQAVQLAEAVVEVLHRDVTLGGLVVHGYVSNVEPGYAVRNNVLLQAVRMTWTGLSKTRIV